MPSKSQKQHDLMVKCLDPKYRELRKSMGKKVPPLGVCRQFLAEDKAEGKWQVPRIPRG